MLDSLCNEIIIHLKLDHACLRRLLEGFAFYEFISFVKFEYSREV